MSLTIATLIFGVFLLICGSALWLSGEQGNRHLLHFAKSRFVGVFLLAIAAVWFLWHVRHLGEADFGDYKYWLFVFFALVAVGSAIYLPEYLTVRSLSALTLLSAMLFLDAAFDQPYAGRLFMVSGVYLLIFLSLYLAVSPYRWRDFFDWLYQKPVRRKALAGVLLGYGLVTLLATFSY